MTSCSKFVEKRIDEVKDVESILVDEALGFSQNMKYLYWRTMVVQG